MEETLVLTITVTLLEGGRSRINLNGPLHEKAILLKAIAAAVPLIVDFEPETSQPQSPGGVFLPVRRPLPG